MRLTLFAFLCVGLGAYAQLPIQPPPPLLSAKPPVPSDPLELVTGEAQAVESVDQRAAVIKLLTDSYVLSNARTQPYDRKTSFTSFGSASAEGTWQVEDISPGANIYRWTAQGPAYSATNLFTNQVLYSNQPKAAIPVRLAQVRSAIFFMRPVTGPRATLRTFNSSINGSTVECILLSHGAARGATGGRRWEEAEYCIDTTTRALITYSTVPGIYVLYDYSQAIHFHNHLIPNKFTIYQAGRPIVEAQTVSVTDPPKDDALYQREGLTQIGVGPLMIAPQAFGIMRNIPTIPPGPPQVVVIHAMQSASGECSDLEVVASSNSSLNADALSSTANILSRPTANSNTEPGATPQSHEVLITFVYMKSERI